MTKDEVLYLFDTVVADNDGEMNHSDEFMIEFARRVLRRAWQEIDATIPRGPLQGDGFNATAQRNGVNRAASLIYDMMENLNHESNT